LFLGAKSTGGDMYGFRCAQFPKPEYEALQRLRKDVLGGVTQRVAIATALRVTAEVVREGGVRRVVQHCTEFRGTAPSEVEELLPAHAVPAAPTQAKPGRSPEPTSPPVVEEPTEVVNLRREVWLNGERFGPGRYVVTEAKAAGLRAIERG